MSADPERATHVLHRLTSYSPERDWTEVPDDDRMVQDLVPNDLTRFPRFYKGYDPQLPRTVLPVELPVVDLPAVQVLAGVAEVAPSSLDLAGLARLLHLSAGVTRRATRPDGRQQLFRAAGSAGARFPLELYVTVPSGAPLPGLAPAVHWYDPEAHALVEIGPAPLGDAPSVVVTGVPWRTGWRYRERGFRHIYWDAGTMLSQLLALSDSAGLTARLFTTFADVEVAALVGVDRVDEFPVAVVALGTGSPAITTAGDAVAGEYDGDGLEFPLVTAAQRAGECDALGPEVGRGAPVVLTGPLESPGLDEVIRSKGSVRRLRPDRSVPGELLVDAMSVATRGMDLPHWVGASAVDGVPTGVFRWPDASTPDRALAEDALREELYQASLEQGLARDAAFVAMSGVELESVDDHGYREVQLLAGLAEGRLHLMAYALGAAATGMTFQDSDLPGLLGTDVAGLLWTCVGVPEYRTRRSGRPGAPTDIEGVRPR